VCAGARHCEMADQSVKALNLDSCSFPLIKLAPGTDGQTRRVSVWVYPIDGSLRLDGLYHRGRTAAVKVVKVR
jgi:hypothetical protein